MRDREKGLRSCSKRLWCSPPGASQRIGWAFCALSPCFAPTPSPPECTLLLHTHFSTRVYSSGETQAFTYKSLGVSRSQVPPVLRLFTLLFHNAGINFSKPIWAVARFGKERGAELLCGGKFPLHTSLEVDRFPLYAARFNLHTEQREWGIEGGQEGERALNTQLGITNVLTEVSPASPRASFHPFASSATLVSQK